MENRVKKLLNLTEENALMGPFQLLHYKKGEQLRNHFDWFGEDILPDFGGVQR